MVECASGGLAPLVECLLLRQLSLLPKTESPLFRLDLCSLPRFIGEGIYGLGGEIKII